jgi:hypothetical protein
MAMLVGLDLGKLADFTAAAAVEQTEPPPPGPFARADERPRDHRGQVLKSYDVVHLQRWPLGAPYPQIVRDVGELMRQPPLGESPYLVVDAGGVGEPVLDLLRADRIPDLIGVKITAGTGWNREGHDYSVSKQVLVATLQVALQTGRLRVVPTLPLAQVLREEMLGFEVKITDAAHETFSARSGKHDDLVLAVAIAVFVGENPRPVTVRPIVGPPRPHLSGYGGGWPHGGWPRY